VAVKIGVPGATVLAVEDFASMKCFHGGGIAKWWIPDRVAAGRFGPPQTVSEAAALRPFLPLSRGAYEAGEGLKDLARRLGYYRLFSAQA
jgi:hypothetical protein